jgi:thiamine transporter ThiT
MAESSSEYHRGEMDVHAQVETYHGFMKLTKWGSLAIAVVVLMLTMWFCTNAGFLAGLITGVVLLVAGIAVLREKPGAGSH